MKKSLQSSEWILVSNFLLVFCFICLFTKLKVHKLSSTIPVEFAQPDGLIAVTIQGAVSKPGVYLVSSGTPIEKIIKKSRPKKYANLKSLDLTQKIEAPIELTIEEKTEITVSILQDQKPCLLLTLPIGVRFCDLKSKIDVDPSLSQTLFKSRRLLQDGEEISFVEKKD